MKTSQNAMVGATKFENGFVLNASFIHHAKNEDPTASLVHESLNFSIMELEAQWDSLIRRMDALADASHESWTKALQLLPGVEQNLITTITLEEYCMKRAEYPDQINHSRAHRTFLERYMSRRTNNNAAGPEDVREMLTWWLEHVPGCDRPMFQHFAF